jgi:hypothetical protein
LTQPLGGVGPQPQFNRVMLTSVVTTSNRRSADARLAEIISMHFSMKNFRRVVKAAWHIDSTVSHR